MNTLQNSSILSGDLYVAAGEGEANKYLTDSFKNVIDNGENINIHYDTQDADQIFKHLDAGILDFGVVYTNDSLQKYNKLTLPIDNITGIVMPKTDELATKDTLANKIYYYHDNLTLTHK